MTSESIRRNNAYKARRKKKKAKEKRNKDIKKKIDTKKVAKPKKNKVPKYLREVTYMKWLKRTVEFWFRKWVVLRDGKCVICGTKDQLTNGHYFSRRNLATKWDEQNAHCQCIKHNYAHENNPEPYRRYMISLYGEAGLSKLEEKRRSLHHPTCDELEGIIVKCINDIKHIDPKQAEKVLKRIEEHNIYFNNGS